MDKEELLLLLSELPLNTLQKLYTYSKYIMIPEEDVAMNVTMQTMVEKAHTIADAVFPEWTDRSKSDFGEFLVELIALFSEKDFWYVNAFGNEAIFSNVSVYSNAFVGAISRAYNPIVYKSARATFDVLFAAGAAYTYSLGELVLIDPDTGLKFTNNSPVTIDNPLVPVLRSLNLDEGTFYSQNYTFNGHSIFIDKKYVDVESVRVYKDNVEWTRVLNFGRSLPDSKHFLVLPEEDGSCSIFFGRDGLGETPAVSSSFIIRYRQCSGTIGNIGIRTMAVNKQATQKPILTVEMKTPAERGATAESLRSLIENTLLFAKTKNLANNVTNTKAYLLGTGEFKKAYVTLVGNNVFFYLVKKDGSFPTLAELAVVESQLQPLLSMGYECSGQLTETVQIPSIVVTAYITKGVNVENAKTTIKQYLQDFTNPLVFADYGAEFNLFNILLFMRGRVLGLTNLIFSSPVSNVSVDFSKIIEKTPLNQITVNVELV